MGRTVSASKRKARLDAQPPKVLYHQTNQECASSILQTQLKPGLRGAVGAGIYFANTAAATWEYASRHGVILTVKVRLGCTKVVTADKFQGSFAELATQGYDSVCFQSDGYPHIIYVVYNGDQTEVVGCEATAGSVVTLPSAFRLPAAFEVKGLVVYEPPPPS